eukprot:g1503.t1
MIDTTEKAREAIEDLEQLLEKAKTDFCRKILLSTIEEVKKKMNKLATTSATAASKKENGLALKEASCSCCTTNASKEETKESVATETGAVECVDVEEEEEEEEEEEVNGCYLGEKTLTFPDSDKLIGDYSWDQSKKFVRLYVPFKDLKSKVNEKKATVELECRNYSFKLTIRDESCGNFTLCIPNLCYGIHGHASKTTVKTDMVVVKLRKSCDTEVWNSMTDERRKSERSRQRRMKGKLKNATTAELLQDMFKHADDATRKNLRDAWVRSFY